MERCSIGGEARGKDGGEEANLCSLTRKEAGATKQTEVERQGKEKKKTEKREGGDLYRTKNEAKRGGIPIGCGRGISGERWKAGGDVRERDGRGGKGDGRATKSGEEKLRGLYASVVLVARGMGRRERTRRASSAAARRGP